ncbi:MAG: MaoC family dehydratase [Burkholderiales bacterium]
MNSPTPSAPARLYWEDFSIGSVREFGALPVTREAVLAFAAEFDPQPFHLDDAAAATSLFGRLSASGWHTCAMTMRMTCDAVLLHSSSLGSPGLDNLRWHHPVFPGDVLSARLTTLDARPMASRPTVGLVLSKWETLNQDGRLVLSMQGWGMFGRRDPAPTALTDPADQTARR